MLIFIKAKGNHEYKINAAKITNAILVKMGPKQMPKTTADGTKFCCKTFFEGKKCISPGEK